MSARPSPMSPDASVTSHGGSGPARSIAQRAVVAAPGLLVGLAVAALAGFVSIAGTLLAYDGLGDTGPLGSVSDSMLVLINRVCIFVIAPVTYAVATWRLGALGAVVAALGVMILGPMLWGLSPWASVDSSARYGYYDEGRGWTGLLLLLVWFWSFVIVAPIAYVVHRVSRH